MVHAGKAMFSLEAMKQRGVRTQTYAKLSLPVMQYLQHDVKDVKNIFVSTLD